MVQLHIDLGHSVTSTSKGREQAISDFFDSYVSLGTDFSADGIFLQPYTVHVIASYTALILLECEISYCTITLCKYCTKVSLKCFFVWRDDLIKYSTYIEEHSFLQKTSST